MKAEPENMVQEPDTRIARQHAITVWVILGSVCVVLAGLIGLPVGPLRVPAGIVTTFFAPGYTALSALGFLYAPGRINHFIFSVPVSLAICIATGVLLNISPLGVRLEPMGVMLCVLCIVLLGIAWRRQRITQPPSMRRVPQSSVLSPQSSPLSVRGTRKTLSVGVLVAIALLLGASMAAALWTGYGIITASQDIPVPFTELYAVNTPTLGNKDGGRLELQLGVNNNETRPITYTVQVFVETAVGGTLPTGEQQITLPAGETWEGTFPVTLNCNDAIAAQLLVPGEKGAYRTVRVRPDCASKAAP